MILPTPDVQVEHALNVRLGHALSVRLPDHVLLVQVEHAAARVVLTVLYQLHQVVVNAFMQRGLRGQLLGTIV